MNSKNRLYNMIFPLFFLFLYPFTWVWLLVIFGNLAIDTLVVYFCLRKVKKEVRRQVIRKSWYKVWGFGYLSDVLGFIILIAIIYGMDFLLPFSLKLNAFENAVMYNPWESFPALLFVFMILLLTGWMIYRFNVRFSFSKTNLKKQQIRKIALALAVFTTPYVLLFPLSLFWK